MKILHIIERFQKAAGTSAFCGALVNQFAEDGVDCRLLVKAKEKDLYPVDGRILTFWGDVECVLADGWIPDVVHIHAIWPPWLHKMHRWARRRGIPVVLSPHGMLAPWAMAHKRWKKLLPWWLYQRADVAKATLIHTTSSKETEEIRALGFKNPIVEAPLGTTLPATVAAHNGSVKYLLFVGRIYPVKGLDLLLKAWALARIQGWHLVCVGPDQAGHMGALKTLAQSLGLSVRHGGLDGIADADVTFTGALYGASKDEAYLGARGLILPSYTENFGGVVVDALSFGLPVLTSNGTPWNHLVAAGCGLRFDLSPKSLTETLKDVASKSDVERIEMGARGRQLVKAKYTWPAVSASMLAAYRSLVDDIKA